MSSLFALEKISFLKALDALVDYHNLVREKLMVTGATAITSAPKKPNKFISFLDHVGADFKNGLTKVMPIMKGAGEAAVQIFFPAASALFDQTVNAVVTAEQAAAAVGAQAGTGSQKLSSVVTLMGPLIAQALSDVGKPNDNAAVQKYVSAVVTILNAMPAPAPAPSAASLGAEVVAGSAASGAVGAPTATAVPSPGPGTSAAEQLL